ncbi:hypothetical protein OAW68_07465, partial [Alphaproteobacteria bacterium]|nr:hypothetical protein [Alphaproteobacteria bacterium]
MIRKNNQKHLLIISSVWPHVSGSFEAANIVTHSIISELVSLIDYKISFLCVNKDLVNAPLEAQDEIDKLRKLGVNFLNPLRLAPPFSLRENPLAFLKAILFTPEIVHFGYDCSDMLKKHINQHVDVVLTLWSELGLNVSCKIGNIRVAYHGNPDIKVFDAQYEINKLIGIKSDVIKTIFDRLIRIIKRPLIEKGHLNILKRYN